ncbi:hypothetical protein [Stakelama marina]|uniref:Uncharacterized protein n=1 Tax=Stakelama marina TaxID=2826939 RepID=A0A8T4ID46_9SPHN|nr:hypothetical protein [Stakelama marina]MBR0552413.1 hypothetical protein [Stakelama marina]
MTDRRKWLLAFAAILLTIGVVRHPSANINILTHDAGDPAPHRLHAALDLGIGAVSVLVTWTGSTLAR